MDANKAAGGRGWRHVGTFILILAFAVPFGIGIGFMGMRIAGMFGPIAAILPVLGALVSPVAIFIELRRELDERKGGGETKEKAA